MTGLRGWVLPAVAVVALGYLATMVAIGTMPVQRQLVRFEAKGVLPLQPEAVRRVAINREGRSVTLIRRGEKAWTTAEGDPLEPSASAQLDTAVNVLHRSGPVREIGSEELSGVDQRPFGLDSPTLVVSVFDDAATPVLTARFGALNPEGMLQYMRLDDAERLYLMSRFVATEWITALEEATGP